MPSVKDIQENAVTENGQNNEEDIQPPDYGMGALQPVAPVASTSSSSTGLGLRAQAMTGGPSDFAILESLKTIGFLAHGLIARYLVKTLLRSNHTIHLYGPCPGSVSEFLGTANVYIHFSATSVVNACDLIMCCLETETLVRTVFFREVLPAIESGKSYVEMTPLRPQLIDSMHSLVVERNAHFLDLQLIGIAEQAEIGRLLALASGDIRVYDRAMTCTMAISRLSYFLGSDNQATAIAIILRLGMSTRMLALTEMMALTDWLEFPKPFLQEIMDSYGISGEVANTSIRNVISTRPSSITMRMIIRDALLVIRLCENIDIQLPADSIVYEMLKIAAAEELGENNLSVAFLQAKFGY